MIIRTDEIKELCAKILFAVDSSENSILTETLQLITEGNYLYLSVTNRTYYAQVKFDMKSSEQFHATVNATLFLKLISQTTTETIELNVKDNYLLITANGSYKLPLIFDGDKLLELPKIAINNVTADFNINVAALHSMLAYNSKEFTKGFMSNRIMQFYYLDENGAITFNTGACVNNFTLEKPVKLLLDQKLVKLFKLFVGETVHFTLGYDALNEELTQTKVRFEDDSVSITYITSCKESDLNSVPVTTIREIAEKQYPYLVSFNKHALAQAISRIALFDSQITGNTFNKMTFNADGVTIYDARVENAEEVLYNNNVKMPDTYEATIEIRDLKSTIDICTDSYINLAFGDHQAFVIPRGTVYNIIPEVS